jgi:hypothetical protein
MYVILKSFRIEAPRRTDTFEDANRARKPSRFLRADKKKKEKPTGIGKPGLHTRRYGDRRWRGR